MRFVKGHGTENDFVILPDPGGELDLTPDAVARLCDRRAGIGADGVLRVVPTERIGEPAVAALLAEHPGASWFMDYRNADGSVAEMCGNGLRVFARFLVDEGWAEPGAFTVATRAGVRGVRSEASGDVTVEMGPPRRFGTGAAVLGGRTFPGVAVDVGNPHLACRVDEPVATLDLSRPPEFDAGLFPAGANVEFFRPLGDRHVEMRVFERGSGETRSCGTGTVAVALAAAGASGAGEWTVDVPGGRVAVTLGADTAYLTGPAVLVADGTVRSSLVG